MKIETKAVHAGDRKRNPDAPGAFVPSSTPIYTATTYFYEDTAKLDRVLGPRRDWILLCPLRQSDAQRRWKNC